MNKYILLLCTLLLSSCYGNAQYNPHWLDDAMGRDYHPDTSSNRVNWNNPKLYNDNYNSSTICTQQMQEACVNNYASEKCRLWHQQCRGYSTDYPYRENTPQPAPEQSRYLKYY